MSLDSIAIRYKISFITLVAIVSFSGYVFYNYLNLNENNHRLTKISEVYFPILENTDANVVRLDNIQKSLLTAIEVDDEDEIDLARELVTDFKAAFEVIKQLDEESAGNVDELVAAFDGYFSVALVVTHGMLAGDLGVADKNAEMVVLYRSLNKKLKHFRKSSYERFTSEIAEVNLNGERGVRVGLVVGCVAALVLIITSLMVVKTVIGSIGTVAVSLREIASGLAIETNRDAEAGKEIIGESIADQMARKTVGLSTSTAENNQKLLGSVRSIHEVLSTFKVKIYTWLYHLFSWRLSLNICCRH